MAGRRCSLVALVSLAACQFDAGGTRLDGDDPGVRDAAATADAGPSMIDAPLTDPPDAADTPAPVTCDGATCAPDEICCVDFGASPSCTAEADCQGAALACDEPADCPGEACCMYGGFGSACGATCFGGDQVCDAPSDCGSIAGQCCPSDVGPSVCRVLCF